MLSQLPKVKAALQWQSSDLNPVDLILESLRLTPLPYGLCVLICIYISNHVRAILLPTPSASPSLSIVSRVSGEGSRLMRAESHTGVVIPVEGMGLSLPVGTPGASARRPQERKQLNMPLVPHRVYRGHDCSFNLKRLTGV